MLGKARICRQGSIGSPQILWRRLTIMFTWNFNDFTQ